MSPTNTTEINEHRHVIAMFIQTWHEGNQQKNHVLRERMETLIRKRENLLREAVEQTTTVNPTKLPALVLPPRNSPVFWSTLNLLRANYLCGGHLWEWQASGGDRTLTRTTIHSPRGYLSLESPTLPHTFSPTKQVHFHALLCAEVANECWVYSPEDEVCFRTCHGVLNHTATKANHPEGKKLYLTHQGWQEKEPT